jgi:hypothetical protein
MQRMQQRWSALAGCSLLAMLFGSIDAAGVSPKSWTLYHATLGESGSAPAFVKRGRIQLALKDDDDDSSQEEPKMPVGVKDAQPSAFALTIEHETNALTDALTKSLLVDNAMYQLKLVADDGSLPVLTSVPACHVRRANFRYVLCFVIDCSNMCVVIGVLSVAASPHISHDQIDF